MILLNKFKKQKSFFLKYKNKKNKKYRKLNYSNIKNYFQSKED